MSENPQSQSPQQPGPPPQQPGPAYGTPQPQPGQPYQGQPPYQGPPQPGPAYTPGQPYPVQPLNPSDERMWTVFAQVGAILFSFIPPLVIWLVMKDRSRFVDQEAKEALNFQITLVIVHFAAALITAATLGFGVFVYLVFVAALVFMILAAVANGKGEPYRFPVNIRFIK